MKTVYVETTIVSLLVARPSRDLVMAGHQAETRQWWNERRSNYRCVTSSEVVRGASQGDAVTSALRIEALQQLDILKVDERALEIAGAIIVEGILPPEVLPDAIYATMASMHRANILLTWNRRASRQPGPAAAFEEFYGAAWIDAARGLHSDRIA